MTPMVFAKGLADSGCWGDKLFGRLVSEELRGGGHGYGLRKASQAKVIYGLEPIFESGRTCVIKVSSLLVFGPSSETSLLGRNYDVTIQVPCPIPRPSFHCPQLGSVGKPSVEQRHSAPTSQGSWDGSRGELGYVFGAIVFPNHIFVAETFLVAFTRTLHGASA